MQDDELERAIGKLRADYAEQLPRAVAQMEALWRQLVAVETAPTAMDELMRTAHSIAGAGGTFGFDQASRAARALELALDPFRLGSSIPDATAQAGIAALLDELKQAALRPS